MSRPTKGVKDELDRLPDWSAVRGRRAALLGCVPLVLALLPLAFVAWLWHQVDDSDDTYNAIIAALTGSGA